MVMKINFTVMVNNSININKTNNHLSPKVAQLIEHKKRPRHMVYFPKPNGKFAYGQKTSSLNYL
jgi:hypothetical protein